MGYLLPLRTLFINSLIHHTGMYRLFEITKSVNEETFTQVLHSLSRSVSEKLSMIENTVKHKYPNAKKGYTFTKPLQQGGETVMVYFINQREDPLCSITLPAFRINEKDEELTASFKYKYEFDVDGENYPTIEEEIY
jgi:hypothetical protein